jgi:shikimate dehydrogenase
VKLVVLGEPVGHSLSPAIHRAALAAAGIPGTYEALSVDGHGMVGVVSDIRAGAFDGANVTMPHKQLALALADRADDLASRAGAANTLVREDASVVAYNTDIGAVRSAWAEAGLPTRGPALILGAGGAAAAALVALQGREISISARQPPAAAALLAATGIEAVIVDWGTRLAGAVVVNATPIGMHLEGLPVGVGVPDAGVFDMAYGSGTTPLVAAAKAAGLPCVDGEAMLIAQAAISFELWTGVAPDRVAMRAGLEVERAKRGIG